MKEETYETFDKQTICNNFYNTYGSNYIVMLAAEYDVA